MMWVVPIEMGLATLLEEREFVLDLDHEVHQKYSEQDLEHQTMKMKEIDELLWMNVFFSWRLVDLDLDFQQGGVMAFYIAFFWGEF